MLTTIPISDGVRSYQLLIIDLPRGGDTAAHRAFYRGRVVTGDVIARQQQAGQGGMHRGTRKPGRAGEGRTLLDDDAAPARCGQARQDAPDFLIQPGGRAASSVSGSAPGL